MTEAEVDSVLGDRRGDGVVENGERLRVWIGESGWLLVTFDEESRTVKSKKFLPSPKPAPNIPRI
jgi:hypothetical protein